MTQESIGDGIETCLFCGGPLGDSPVYDEVNGVSACEECGHAEIATQQKEKADEARIRGGR